jgi:predicted transposase YdaD
MASHDEGYKLLFSHPRMVEDLLCGFVEGDWVQNLDFSTLEKASGHYVSEDLRERESDMVWRVRWGQGEWLYIYLLLEFQSTVDPYMGVRMMTYKGMLFQDIIAQKLVLPSGKLPPVFAALLYNGRGRWNAARNVADLVERVPGLEEHHPQHGYFLLDVMRLAESRLASSQNLVVALFRLERSRGLAEVRQLVIALAEWLREPEQAELQRAFASWIARVLLPSRLPGVTVPEVGSLQEAKAMLADAEIDWTREWKEQGLEEGRQQGLQQGLQQGQEKTHKEDLRVLRETLLKRLGMRFGPVPASARERLDTIDSIERLADLIAESVVAPSLAALGLE